uniref:Uncharacterized protein n=1 Tax=Cynoglossus semilaevis TaxID=244447 RepID=A0A3P8W6I1_CYNSE
MTPADVSIDAANWLIKVAEMARGREKEDASDDFLFSEIVPRDVNMKGKFIQHFTGKSERRDVMCYNCYNYYKRCARLLIRLAMSPLCTQS